MNGKRYYGYITSTTGAIFASFGLLYLVSMCGGTDTELGFFITSGFSVAAGIAMAIFLWRTTRYSVEVLGIAAGFFIGCMAYMVIALTTGFGPEWACFSEIFFSAGAGGVLAWKRPNYAVLIATSVIGAYLAMRGAGTIFGN